MGDLSSCTLQFHKSWILAIGHPIRNEFHFGVHILRPFLCRKMYLYTVWIMKHHSHCVVSKVHIHIYAHLTYTSFASGPLVRTEEEGACVLARNLSISLTLRSCAGSRACAGCTNCICRLFNISLVRPLSLPSNCNPSLPLKTRKHRASWPKSQGQNLLVDI